MNDQDTIGTIEWRDLTVEHADGVSAFYQAVVGWQREPVPMDGYDDFNMTQAQSGETIAGICHARGDNKNLPAQWMMYVRVADVEQSVQSVKELGGAILKGPTSFAGDTYYVINDPAGAILTIFSRSTS